MARRSYDHRLKQMYFETGDPNLFPHLKIPRTTILTWIKKGTSNITTLENMDDSKEELLLKNETLSGEVKKLEALCVLLKNIKCVIEVFCDGIKFKSKDLIKIFIKSIKSACDFLTLKECLKEIGMNSARYYYLEKSLVECEHSKLSCPRIHPSKLTKDELLKIKDLVTNEVYSHFSISSLYYYAKRMDLIYSSLSTWYRTIKEHNFLRPLKRIHPLKPKIGIRAHSPNHIWHMDMSVFRFIDGTKAYIQAVIDNYSRYILAYEVSDTYGGGNSKGLLLKAIEVSGLESGDNIPELFIDSGTENLNSEVQELEDNDLIKKVVAQIDVHFSNSMIEAFFRKLKHHYLFKKLISNLGELQKNVDFFVSEHNQVIPLLALSGGTPFEVFRNEWTEENIKILKDKAKAAHNERININQKLACDSCSNKI